MINENETRQEPRVMDIYSIKNPSAEQIRNWENENGEGYEHPYIEPEQDGDTIQENEPQATEQTARVETTKAEPLSIKPSIAETERFMYFLNDKFNLGIKNDLIVLIHETSPNIRGFYRSSKCANKVYRLNDKTAINQITISSHILREVKSEYSVYGTIAHELAHYLETLNGYKGNGTNYHTKGFKKQAEKLLLVVERGRYGFNITTESDEFKTMLDEFKPSPKAFKIFQDTATPNNKAKKGRLIKYVCSCNCIIRTARNENKPLKAVCGYCDTEFKSEDGLND